MKKFLKVLIFSVIGILAFAYLAFRIYFSPERVERLFVSTASSVLNRPVDVSSARLTPGGLSLEGLEVGFREEGEVPEGVTNFISCERIFLQFRLAPLLRRQLVFKKIELEAPEVNFIRKIAFDYKRLFGGILLNRTITRNMSFSIGCVEVREGKVNMYPPDFPELKMVAVDISVEEIGRGTGYDLSFSSEFLDSELESLDINAAVDRREQRTLVNEIVLKGYEGEFVMSGYIDNVLGNPAFNLQWGVRKFPHGLLSDFLTFEGRPRISGTVKEELSSIDLEWSFDFTDSFLSISDIYYKQPGRNLKFMGRAGLDNEVIKIDWCVFETGGTFLSFVGEIYGGEINLSVIADSIELTEAVSDFPGWRKYIAGGEADINGAVSGSLDDPLFSGRISSEDVRVENFSALENLFRRITGIQRDFMRLGNTDVDLKIDREKLNIESLSADNGDIRGSLSGSYFWDGNLDFNMRPNIFGRELIIKVSGSTDRPVVDLN